MVTVAASAASTVVPAGVLATTSTALATDPASMSAWVSV